MALKLPRYILKRLLGLVPVLFIIVTASFFLIRVAPGGPFDSERMLSPEVESNVEKTYGLDKPLAVQYLEYMKKAVVGDFGYSFSYPDKTVAAIIGKSFPVSFALGSVALALALIFGLPLGALAAVKRGRYPDYMVGALTVFGVSVPSIVLCPVTILIFGIWLKVFPVGGWGGIKELILPSVCLGAVYLSFIIRLTRESLLDSLEKEYVKTARGAGIGERKIVLKYALKGSLLPVISYLGPAFAGIITGSLVIERIFFIPGLGQHFVQAALNRDYPLALGTVVFYSALLLVINLITDIVYVFIDPRISYEP